MKRAVRRFSVMAIVAVMVLLTLTGLALAKSLYVIIDKSISPIPISVYDVSTDGTLTFQNTRYLSGTVGAKDLALDSVADTMFVICEGSNVIYLVDIPSMAVIGSATVSLAYELAGIVVDRVNKRVYTMGRFTSDLYVLNWDPVTKTLSTPVRVVLTDVGGGGAYGLALDNPRGLLYVSNYNLGYGIGSINAEATGGIALAISYYNTSDWSQAGSLELSGPAIGIAVDSSREMLYSGSGVVGFPQLDYYNLQSGAKDGLTIDPYSGPQAIVVDEETGLVYATTGSPSDELRSFRYNATLANLEPVQNVGYLGNFPAGMAISAGFNPLNLEKTANTPTISPGKLLTYTFNFNNLDNPFAVHNVILSDVLPPGTRFVSANGGGVYNAASNSVTWNLGDLVSGAPSGSVKLVVRVLATAPVGTNILNTASISSDETQPTVRSVETQVVSPGLFSMTFPVYGYDPYNAPVICVLDHSVYDTRPVQFYVTNGRVKAFNGELAESSYGANKLDGYWDGYKNSSGSDFLVETLNYVHGPFLYYDGHPGYDYQVPKGTPIRATAKGELHLAPKDPVNGGGWKGYKTFYIKHQVFNGAKIINYFTWYLYVKPKPGIMNQIAANGFATVRKGQIIGRTYNDWVHVDFRRGGNRHSAIYDPYQTGMWDPVER